MLKKFALTDDGGIQRLPSDTPDGDAEAAGRQLGTDVLFTLDKAALKKLRENIDVLLAEDERNDAIAHMDALSLSEAIWWFIENVPKESAAHSHCYWSLRARRGNETR
jgi:hypothetical protein